MAHGADPSERPPQKSHGRSPWRGPLGTLPGKNRAAGMAFALTFAIFAAGTGGASPSASKSAHTMTVSFVIEMLGTLAFAISGIRLASAKKFDWFGAYVVGFTTAIGGGTLRDVMLSTTPFWMLDSVYLVVTAIALGIVIALGRYLIRLNNTFFVFDAIGLGLFTVVGIEKTLAAGFPLWVAIIMGTITGAAGGVLRDILINEVPLIFRKEIYALACVFGGVVFWLCGHLGIGGAALQVITAVAVIAARIVAVYFGLKLPTLRASGSQEP